MKTDKTHNLLLTDASYLQVLGQIHEGVMILDVNRTIVFCNSMALQIMGLLEKDIINTKCYENSLFSIYDKYGRELCNEENCPLLNAMYGKKTFTHSNYVFIKNKHGKKAAITLSYSPLRDANESVIGVSCVFQNIGNYYQQKLLVGGIQQKMIAESPLTYGNISIDTLYNPVDDTSGDFIDCVYSDNSNIYAAIADATGHGISAAIFTIAFKALFYAALQSYSKPEHILQQINKELCETGAIEGNFLSAAVLHIKAHTGKGSIAAAGHPPGLIFNKTDNGAKLTHKIGKPSFLLGIEKESTYQACSFSLKKGEFLFIYTDGIAEAEESDGILFGEEGIISFMENYQGDNPLSALLDKVQLHSKYPELLDDVSMMLFTRI